MEEKMNFQPTLVEEKLAQEKIGELYVDPAAYEEDVIRVYENIATCFHCQKKTMKVLNWKKRQAVCTSCKKETSCHNR